MKDEDIDLSDIPEIPPEKIAGGVVRRGLKPVGPKEQLTLHLDRDLVQWYRKQRGYQARINALLRDYMVDYLRDTASSRTRRAS